MGMDFPGIERLAALRTDHDRIKEFAAGLVLVQQGSPPLVHHMDIAPVNDCHQDRVKIQALLGEDVLVPLRAHLIRRPPQDTESYELFEPVREQMACDAELRLKLLEASDTKETVAKDQQAPAIADDGERTRNGARFLLKRVPFHSNLQPFAVKSSCECSYFDGRSDASLSKKRARRHSESALILSVRCGSSKKVQRFIVLYQPH
jgi:hypothetical protein